MTISITVPSNDKFAMRIMAEALLRIATEGEGFSTEKSDNVVGALMNTVTTHFHAEIKDAVREADSGDFASDADVSDVREKWTGEPAAPVFERSIPTAAELVSPPPPVEASTSDADGFPWDARIHAESKGLTVNGTWRARRKPSDMDVDQWAAYQESVRGELKALMSIPAIVPPMPPVVVPPPPVAAPLPPVVTAPPAPMQPANSTPVTFQEFMVWLTSHAAKDDAERAQQVARIDSTLATYNLQSVSQLNQRPDLIPMVYDSLCGVL